MINLPHFPLYSKVKILLKLIEEKNESELKQMMDNIWALRGTPQEPQEWQNPDEWISERLNGKDAILAKYIWEHSEKKVNPRYLVGIMYMSNYYKLIKVENGVIKITERGKDFISAKENKIEKEIDYEEGCMFILYLCYMNDDIKRGNILDEWINFSQSNSNNRKISVFKDSLRRRLANLVDRNYILKKGNIYNITDDGLKYISSFESKEINKSVKKELSEYLQLNKQVEEYDKKQRKLLKEKLYELSPIQFENLIKILLEKMNYEDVERTSPTNDKGVDVVGVIQNGITSIKEVIQVKRLSSNVQRTVLDGLRGSLHRFNAFKGTIITLSDFSKGAIDASFERGAAPITLINGDKLIELLIEYEVGTKKKPIPIFQIDDNFIEELKEESSE